MKGTVVNTIGRITAEELTATGRKTLEFRWETGPGTDPCLREEARANIGRALALAAR